MDWYFCSHRIQLARAAKEEGYEVFVVTDVSSYGDIIRSAGLNLIPIKVSRRSLNPFSEIRLILKLVDIYRKEKPDIVHHVALKPVIYGAIAAWVAKVPLVISAIAGLGYLFSAESLKIRVLRSAIKIAFRMLLTAGNQQIIVQNPDDKELLSGCIGLDSGKISLIRGSGVDTRVYKCSAPKESTPVVLLASRMLWSKGIGDFVSAAKRIRNEGIEARFILVGGSDADNPSSISTSQLRKWNDDGLVEWWGHKDDMVRVFESAHIVCLPSYYGEGVPKVLIEAASCGRPIVTTNTPGCREIVHSGENGYLVPPQNVDALASALKQLIVSPESRSTMGANGRERVKTCFSHNQVIRETMSVYKGSVT